VANKKNAFNTVTTFSKILALVMFVMFPVAAFYIGISYQERIDRPYMNSYDNNTRFEKIPNENAVCTQDAKLCPDGSSVGRTGPNCEFAKCPGE